MNKDGKDDKNDKNDDLDLYEFSLMCFPPLAIILFIVRAFTPSKADPKDLYYKENRSMHICLAITFIVLFIVLCVVFFIAFLIKN